MRMTNAEGVECLSILTSIHEKGKLGYAIAKNMRKLNDEMREYFEKRDELIQKYGEKQDGEKYKIPPESVQKFMDELREYDEIEFDFEPHMIGEEEFCRGELTSDQMYGLCWMVAE